MNAISKEEIQQRLKTTLKEKIAISESLVVQWYDFWEGAVVISFSGGKDSTVLLHLVRSLYPDVPAVFVDTGLEYPEIKAFVNTIDNVDIIRPKKAFHKIIKEHGYPVVSKKTAKKIRTLRENSPKSINVRTLYDTGYNRKGEFCQGWKLAG